MCHLWEFTGGKGRIQPVRGFGVAIEGNEKERKRQKRVPVLERAQKEKTQEGMKEGRLPWNKDGKKGQNR